MTTTKKLQSHYHYYQLRMKCMETCTDHFEQKELKHDLNGMPIMHVKHTTCPECGFPLNTTDLHHNETLCGQCGLIIDHSTGLADPKYFHGRSKDPLPEHTGFLRKDEKKIIAKLTKKPYYTPMDEWRRQQYYFFAGKVARHYKMLAGLEFLLLKIVRDYNLKNFHPHISYEKIIVGLAIEILRRSGRHVPSHEKLACNTGLTGKHRKVIRSNLERLSIFK